MDNHEVDPITAFDTLYTSNQLQMLKVILPYMQVEMQQMLAIYIKLNELLIALHFSKNTQNNTLYSNPAKKEFDIFCLLKDLSPFLSDSEKERANQFANMQENMEQFKKMSQMMSLMQDMGDGSPESMLQNFLSEDQIAMFKNFEEGFS